MNLQPELYYPVDLTHKNIYLQSFLTAGDLVEYANFCQLFPVPELIRPIQGRKLKHLVEQGEFSMVMTQTKASVLTEWKAMSNRSNPMFALAASRIATVIETMDINSAIKALILESQRTMPSSSNSLFEMAAIELYSCKEQEEVFLSHQLRMVGEQEFENSNIASYHCLL